MNNYIFDNCLIKIFYGTYTRHSRLFERIFFWANQQILVRNLTLNQNFENQDSIFQKGHFWGQST